MVIIEVLSSNLLLTLFVVVSIGYLLGRVNFWGVKFGLAGVLFAGLIFGGLSSTLELPEIVYQLGLVLFVYSLGLNSGSTVLPSLRGKGLIVNLVVAGVIIVGAGLIVLLRASSGLDLARSAGMFAGSLTSTPTLAGILDYIKHTVSPELQSSLLTQPIVGYSIAYPMGVIGMILSLICAQKLWKVDFAKEAEHYGEGMAATSKLKSATVLVKNQDALRLTVDEIIARYKSKIIFGRMKHDGQLGLAHGDMRFSEGDLVAVVGTPELIEDVAKFLGEQTEEQLSLDRAEMDYRRMFVSNPKITGMRLKDLNLPQQFGAVVTRIRRGDVEFVPHGSTILQSGDRVRVVSRSDHIETISKFFGDSYKAVSEVDLVSLGIGITLGILLGLIPFRLGWGLNLKLGIAGGPLVVALILGALRRTGPFNWVMPYSANLVVSQIGLALFFAGVGTRAGHSFISALSDGSGYIYFFCGMVVTFSAALLTMFFVHKVLKVPLAQTFGVLAGLQTQPSVLEFALEQTKNDLPKVGFSMVYPVATITKILMAELLFILLK